jgi:hypothetical protein
VKEEAEVNGAAEVVKDPLESSEVWLSGIMHMEIYLLNCIGDVWAGGGEVLQCTGKTPICSGICHWVALCL